MDRAIDLAMQDRAQLADALEDQRAQPVRGQASDLGARVAREHQRAAMLDDQLDLMHRRQLVAADVLHLFRVGIEVRGEELVGDGHPYAYHRWATATTCPPWSALGARATTRTSPEASRVTISEAPA